MKIESDKGVARMVVGVRNKQNKAHGADELEAFPADAFWLEERSNGKKKSGTVSLSIAIGRNNPSLGYRRDLRADACSVALNHKVDTVVSLIEPHEYRMLGINDYDEALGQYGLKVIKFPIKDVSVPRADEFSAFKSFIKDLHTRLWNGENILIHCRGGKGRAGTVAACLLVEDGYDPLEAQEFIRRVRMGAIETFEQEDYVLVYALDDPTYVTLYDRMGFMDSEFATGEIMGSTPVKAVGDMGDVESSVLGALYGLAVGDALGAPLEFTAVNEYGITDYSTGGWLNAAEGEWTDDTSMALCLADSLLERGESDAFDQLGKYTKWYKDGYMSTRGHCFDIGSTTRGGIEASLQAYTDGLPRVDVLAAAIMATRHATSNGSIMRLAPVPMFYRNEAPLRVVEESAKSSLTTHAGAQSSVACAYLGLLLKTIFDYKKTNSLPSPAELVEEVNTAMLNLPELRVLYNNGVPQRELISRFIRNYTSDVSKFTRVVGHAGSTLTDALWAFCSTDSFEEGVLKAVNLGGDSDTVGAVYGQIAGAYYGLKKIPATWLDRLMDSYIIKEMAVGLYEEPFIGEV